MNVLMKPSVEKIAIAIAYTSTQLMKLGIVVNVCTKRRNLRLLISQRNTANIIGIQLVNTFNILRPSVFLITFIRSRLVASFLNKYVNHLKPTKLLIDKVPPAL